MSRVTVGLGSRSYDILIEHGCIDHAGTLIAPLVRGKRIVVVTEETVAAALLPRLVAGLAAGGLSADPIILPAGEGTKNWHQLSALCDALLVRGIARSDHIIALGGGVIGDLVGFAASILKRGCNFIQIPTSLLAQVDSSVGGKTAINTAAGKNLIGSFHQPAFVLIDPSVLMSLPIRERRAGYAEIVKYGLIDNFAFFEWCEANGAAVIEGDTSAQIVAIENSVKAKAAIVEADERETVDKRALLNLGHTFGHALEAETGFSSRLLHGEAVSAGMALAFRYSARRGLCSAQDSERVNAHLRSVGLPASLANVGIAATGEKLVGHMLHDKKMSSGTLPFLLARGIGQVFVDRTVDLADVAAFLDGETG
jgi:3-dehydroquinate synthase